MLSQQDFKTEFYNSRKFSEQAIDELYMYFEVYFEDTEIEDVTAEVQEIIQNYKQYDSVEEVLKDYPSAKSIDDIEHITPVVLNEPDCIIVCDDKPQSMR